MSLVDMIGSNNKRVERATLLYIINNCNILKGFLNYALACPFFSSSSAS